MSDLWLKSKVTPNVSHAELREAQLKKERAGSLPANESLPSEVPKGYRNKSLSSPDSLPSPDSLSNNLWASITETKGHTKMPNAIFDKLYTLLDVPERVVYEQLFRLSWGFANPLCKVSLPTLSTRAGLGKSATHAAIKRLESKGLVIKESYLFGRNKEQATTYRLPLPEWLIRNERLSRNERLPLSGSIKESNNKRKDINAQSALTAEEWEERRQRILRGEVVETD